MCFILFFFEGMREEGYISREEELGRIFFPFDKAPECEELWNVLSVIVPRRHRAVNSAGAA